MNISLFKRLCGSSVIDPTAFLGDAPVVAKHSQALGRQIQLRLLRLIEDRGLTNRAVAEKALLTNGTINRLRNGDGGQAGVGTIYNIARALQVRPAWLAYGDLPETEPDDPIAVIEAAVKALPAADRRKLIKRLTE